MSIYTSSGQPTASTSSSANSSQNSGHMPVISQKPYVSLLSLIKNIIATDGATARGTPSPANIDTTFSILEFAETNRPITGPQPKLSDAEIQYRVEFNLWCYYFGTGAYSPPFPGSPPAIDDPLVSFTPRALATRSALLKLLCERKEFGEDYHPQMGWNPHTGEPWLAVRCYAKNAYPAVSGPYNDYAKEVGKLVPEFKILFMRFRQEQYVLIWPEFMSTANISTPSAWERFSKFRHFVETWANRNEVDHINDACRKWLQVPYSERGGIDLPNGFRLDMESIAESKDVADTNFETRDYDSWRPQSSSGSSRPSRNDPHLERDLQRRESTEFISGRQVYGVLQIVESATSGPDTGHAMTSSLSKTDDLGAVKRLQIFETSGKETEAPARDETATILSGTTWILVKDRNGAFRDVASQIIRSTLRLSTEIVIRIDGGRKGARRKA